MNRRAFLKGCSVSMTMTVCGKWLHGMVPEDATITPELLLPVARACRRLAPAGWGDLLGLHGLNIRALNLESELLRVLPAVKRRIPGFEDFNPEGKRAIEPGNPSASLLLHAFASPNVRGTDSLKLRVFPTLAEIEAVENLIFGTHPPAWSDLIRSRAESDVAVGVFAAEYRPASKTPHGRYADLCFSQVGIARVGTDEPSYDSLSRCFSPFVNSKPTGLRVLPSKFGVYLCTKLPGTSEQCSILNHLESTKDDIGDDRRAFWIPVHKLFAGPSCIVGDDLVIRFASEHTNTKLKGVHAALQSMGITTGWGGSDLENFPFQFSSGIAEISTVADWGSGVLSPIPHDPLIARAVLNGKLVSFPPKDEITDGFKLQYHIDGDYDNTAFVDATLLEKDGKITDISRLSRDEIKKMYQEGYRAVNFVDCTGEGTVEAVIAGLRHTIQTLSAISLVSPPDFFPLVDPGDLWRWTKKLPLPYRDHLWNLPPISLSDARGSTDVTKSEQDNDTITAVRSLPSTSRGDRLWGLDLRARRISFLPDGAAGQFNPGWEWGRETTQKRNLFTNRWLSSPFAVDMGICASQGTYWPGTVPDLSRWFAPFPTLHANGMNTDMPTFSVAPLTDDELGFDDSKAWDGLPAPSVTRVNGKEYVQFLPSYRAAYAQLIEKRTPHLLRFANMTAEEYSQRVLAITRIYRYLDLGFPAANGDSTPRSEVVVRSLKIVGPKDPELLRAFAIARANLTGKCFRFELASISSTGFQDGNVQGTVMTELIRRWFFFIEANIPSSASLPRKLLVKQSSYLSIEDGRLVTVPESAWTAQNG